MDKNQELYQEFINAVEPEHREFINEIHDNLLQNGCKAVIKPTKNAYLVSYTNKDKKTIANYVFRKSGVLIRIYAMHVNEYEYFLEELPEKMMESIDKASVCKRMINPDDCNSRCPMGYDFMIQDKHYQKCRNSAFMFLINDESKSYIKTFLDHELQLQ